MRTAHGGSFWAVLGCMGTAHQWVLWEALSWAPVVAQREEKQFLTQVLLDLALESAKEVEPRETHGGLTRMQQKLPKL